MFDLIDFLTLLVAIIAVGLSVWSLILQYNVRGPLIELLNAKDIQKILVRPYSGLPKTVQDEFAYYPDQWPGYAVIKLVFGNAGDRAGYVSIANIEIKNDHGLFKYFHSVYNVIPAYEIVEKTFLLRNIPISGIQTVPMEIEVVVTLELGGYHPRSRKDLRTETRKKILKVILNPSPEKPMYTI